MANELAVTQREHQLADNAMLMTTTDTQSRITYVNDAFVEVSGYRRDEIMGGNLSMFRHPDMPAQAFADMWASLKSGLPWNALIKNRCKNGDHFWVHANATPIMRDGVLAGYMSVRTKAQAHEVRAAEALYRRFRAGRARGWVFYRGLVIRTGVWRWMSLPRVISMRARLRLSLALTTLMAFAFILAAGVTGASLAWIGGGLLASSLFASLLLERQLTTPLSAVLQQAQALANGQPVSGAVLDRVDELGMMVRAVNQAGLNLQTLVDDVAQHTTSVDRGSAEVARGSSDLSARTEQQASALEETAASMEELGSTVRRNAEHARQGDELARRASAVATQGGQAVSQVVGTMREINDSSHRIADIIQVIDGIAFQTNILALNAAVEAARAGEQGRGFAVVASEVRSLAQRSAAAAKEIKTLINASVERVERGSALVDRAGATMTGVVDSIQQVLDLTAQISTASQEQALGVAQVGEAVNLLDQATQQNAALVEQSAATAQHLKSQVHNLTSLVHVFKWSARPSVIRGA